MNDKTRQQKIDAWIPSGTEAREHDQFAIPHSTDTTVSPTALGALPMSTFEEAQASMNRLLGGWSDHDPRRTIAIQRIKERWPEIEIPEDTHDTWGTSWSSREADRVQGR